MARLLACFVAASTVLAGCSSGSHSLVLPAPSASPSVAASPTVAPAQDLIVTAAIRAQLIAAGAQAHGLVSSDYTGLAPGRTYYAYDSATATYWAGGALEPSSSSVQAQVSVQDDGGYLLFRRTTGAWQVWDVGLTGIEGSTCPVTVPIAVLAVWHWAVGTCRPPNQ